MRRPGIFSPSSARRRSPDGARERRTLPRVAARRIVRHLLESNAIGAVTTHDLALHDDPALDPNSTKVHFREHVDDSGGRVLTFDYVLRPGLATSRNALKLLRIVGLDEKDGSGGTG